MIILLKFESKKAQCQPNFTHIKLNDTYEQSFCAFFDSVFTDPEISIPRANKIWVQVRAAILSSSDLGTRRRCCWDGRGGGGGGGRENFVLFGCMEFFTLLKSFNHPNKKPIKGRERRKKYSTGTSVQQNSIKIKQELWWGQSYIAALEIALTEHEHIFQGMKTHYSNFVGISWPIALLDKFGE